MTANNQPSTNNSQSCSIHSNNSISNRSI